MLPNVTSSIGRIPNITLFSARFQGVWALVLFVTMVCEVLPLPPVPAALLYSYIGWKVLLFLALGFLAPLAFWRFDSIGFGILLSVAMAGGVEALQSLPTGHRSSFVEFAAKLVLIGFGFLFGLNTRYNGLLRIGKFRCYLVNRHQSFRD